MTKRLAALLAANRHLKGPRVLYRDNGQPATRAALHAPEPGSQGRGHRSAR